MAGTGSTCGVSASGPPNPSIAIARIRRGTVIVVSSGWAAPLGRHAQANRNSSGKRMTTVAAHAAYTGR